MKKKNYFGQHIKRKLLNIISNFVCFIFTKNIGFSNKINANNI